MDREHTHLLTCSAVFAVLQAVLHCVGRYRPTHLPSQDVWHRVTFSWLFCLSETQAPVIVQLNRTFIRPYHVCLSAFSSLSLHQRTRFSLSASRISWQYFSVVAIQPSSLRARFTVFRDSFENFTKLSGRQLVTRRQGANDVPPPLEATSH